MKKQFFSVYWVIIIFVFLLSASIFSGCNSVNTNSKLAENVVGNSEQAAAGNKVETSASETPAAQNSKVLWDFRKNSDAKPVEFSKAETDAVVKYLFGEQANLKVEIRNRISGAFTKPNANETLYYLSGCEDSESGKFTTTDCPHVSWDSVGWIAVFDGTNPLMKIEKALGYEIQKADDVNGDGLNEILSFSGYTGMGIITSGAALGYVSDGKYKVIKEFSGYADNCAAGATTSENDKAAAAAVISYTPANGGKTPDFAEEYFESKCDGDSLGKNPNWKKISKKEFDDFTKNNS